jgi:hypothetical protein
MNSPVQLICLQDDAFHALIDEVVHRIMQAEKLRSEDKWISPEEAMNKLRIKSKTTLQRLRDEGLIRYTQPDKKYILYDSDSINAYLEKHVRETF